MKCTAIAGLTLLSAVAASDAQTAHLLFRDQGAAPAYNLSVVADGSAHDTGNAHTSISLVDAPDYNAAMLCDFDFELADGAEPPAHEFAIGDDGHTGQVKINPPTPVKGIKCQGSCVSNYGTCNGADGQGPKLCCNGFCAADKCRPWDGV